MLTLGRLLLVVGIVLVILGSSLTLGSKLGLTLGRLPGDIRIERNGGGLYLPLATSLLVSIVLTIVINVLMKIFRK